MAQNGDLIILSFEALYSSRCERLFHIKARPSAATLPARHGPPSPHLNFAVLTSIPQRSLGLTHRAHIVFSAFAFEHRSTAHWLLRMRRVLARSSAGDTEVSPHLKKAWTGPPRPFTSPNIADFFTQPAHPHSKEGPGSAHLGHQYIYMVPFLELHFLDPQINCRDLKWAWEEDRGTITLNILSVVWCMKAIPVRCMKPFSKKINSSNRREICERIGDIKHFGLDAGKGVTPLKKAIPVQKKRDAGPGNIVEDGFGQGQLQQTVEDPGQPESYE
ncbi:hypothetical protein C8J57DRAFT_1229536 [Mycena rebaudengoi]|nr:hypothetical protein C8J57DRAFT_1229536 [Mycena rebaudengoi]